MSDIDLIFTKGANPWIICLFLESTEVATSNLQYSK